jgi:hypothetical protein
MSMTPPDQAGPTAGPSAATLDNEASGVPSFITAKDLARGDKLFFGAGRALRKASGFACFLVLIVSLVGGYYLEQSTERYLNGYTEATVMCGYDGICPGSRWGIQRRAHAPGETAQRAREEIRAEYRAESIRETIVLLTPAPVLLFVTWLLLNLFRGKPARVSFLSLPRGRTKADVRKMLRRELRPYGHLIAVRDAVNGVSNDRRLRSYAKRIGDKFAMNWHAAFARTGAMLVSATSDWRLATTQLLARSSDVLIVDLSNGAPEEWNVIQPQASRCVFVSAWGQHERAEATFAALGVPGQCFFYAPDGEIQRRSQFRAAMLAAMRAAHA